MGEVRSRGYSDIAVHPLTAIEILHDGYMVVNGKRCNVLFQHNEAYIAHITVWGSDPTGGSGAGWQP